MFSPLCSEGAFHLLRLVCVHLRAEFSLDVFERYMFLTGAHLIYFVIELLTAANIPQPSKGSLMESFATL